MNEPRADLKRAYAALWMLEDGNLQMRINYPDDRQAFLSTEKAKRALTILADDFSIAAFETIIESCKGETK